MGDVSGSGVGGRMGDVSGSGVGGKIGDVSGLGIGGKIGDVSGDASFGQVQDLVLRDRNTGNIECLEARVNRLEYEVLSITRWLDLRMRALEQNVTTDLQRFQETINEQADQISGLEDRIEELEDENDGGTPQPGSPQPPRET